MEKELDAKEKEKEVLATILEQAKEEIEELRERGGGMSLLPANEEEAIRIKEMSDE